MGFAEAFTNGIRAGSALAGTWSDINARDKMTQWRQEDRDREEDDRKQLQALGAVMGKVDQGDFTPAIALANSKGMFGENKFAAGARLDDKGNVVAQVYDTTNPVWSMSDVPLGSIKDVRNQLVIANMPQRYLGQAIAQQQAKYMDPMQQAQLQGAQADAATKTARAQYAAPAALAGLHAEQAKVGLIGAQTGATNAQAGRTAALTGPEVAKTRAEADLMRARANAPVNGRPVATITSDGPEDSTIRENIYDPNDPRLQRNRPAAVLDMPPASTAGKATGQTGKKQLDAATARAYLQKAGGDKQKARAMALRDGYTF